MDLSDRRGRHRRSSRRFLVRLLVLLRLKALEEKKEFARVDRIVSERDHRKIGRDVRREDLRHKAVVVQPELLGEVVDRSLDRNDFSVAVTPGGEVCDGDRSITDDVLRRAVLDGLHEIGRQCPALVVLRAFLKEFVLVPLYLQRAAGILTVAPMAVTVAGAENEEVGLLFRSAGRLEVVVCQPPLDRAAERDCVVRIVAGRHVLAKHCQQAHQRRVGMFREVFERLADMIEGEERHDRALLRRIIERDQNSRRGPSEVPAA